MPTVTCIVTSHMKGYLLGEALASCVTQTRTDVQYLVVDSGKWIGQDDEISREMAAVYAEYGTHPLFDWVMTREPRLVCPFTSVFNECFRKGLVLGEYVCTFYDDDRYEPTYMEKMAGYLDQHPEAGAVWSGQMRQRIPVTRDVHDDPGQNIPANRVLTPGSIDCRVDGAQVMWRKSLLDSLSDPWMDEGSGNCGHADGVFLERLVGVCGSIPPIDEFLETHRYTFRSAFTPA